MLVMMAEEWGREGPLQSIYKLNLLITKCNRVQDLVSWALASIYDLCKSGASTPGEISLKALKDGAGAGKGMLDLFVAKKQLRDYLVVVDLPKRIRTMEMKVKLMDIFKNHAAYRATFKPFPDSSTTVDVTWIAKLADSEKMTLRLYEALIFGDLHDGTFRFSVRQGKTAADIYTEGPIKEMFDGIDAEAQKEAKVFAEQSHGWHALGKAVG